MHDRRTERRCEQQKYCSRSSHHGETVRVAEPLLPEIVALIVAVVVVETFLPFTVAVAAEFSPVDVTVVYAVIVAPPETNQETVPRPCSGRLFASSTTAVAVVVVFDLTVVAARVTTTLATVPFVTVIVAVPDFPLLVAVIVAWPARPPVTVTLPPLVADRLAMVASLVVHVTVCPARALPAPSFTVAVSVVLAFCAIDGDDGVTETDVTTGTPVSIVEPLTPPAVAVMFVVPAASTVARPEFASIVAT